MNLPTYETRQAVEMYEMVTRLIALAGMTDATLQVCEWLRQSALRAPDPERRWYTVIANILSNADFHATGGDELVIVVCRADRVNGAPGPYELATRQVFDNLVDACAYAASISPSRDPFVVTGRFDELRRTHVDVPA